MPDNQTQQEWLDLPSVANKEDATGTGAYLDQNGAKGFVSNITYERMIETAEQSKFRAFVWVPNIVASEDDVRKAECKNRCVKTCRRPGCICERSTGRCK